MPPTKLTRPQWRRVFELSPIIGGALYLGDLYPARKWDWPDGWLTRKLKTRVQQKDVEVKRG